MEEFEIKIETTHDLADTISAILFSVGAQGVSVIDKEDINEVINSTSNWDYVDDAVLNEPENLAVITTVVENSEKFISAFNDTLKLLLPNVSVKIETRKLENLDWTTEWRKNYKPIKTATITIVPCWIDYEADANEKIIKLEPGMAFGTGEHATTRMCLDLTPSLDGKKVLDVGCGSGILGIAADILGAESVYMCDLDEQCVEAARKNAELNDSAVVIEQADLLNKTDKIGDVVYANLTADILIRLSDKITEHLSDGAKLIVSGIIDSRENEVLNQFLSLGFTVDDRREEGDWRAFRLSWK